MYILIKNPPFVFVSTFYITNSRWQNMKRRGIQSRRKSTSYLSRQRAWPLIFHIYKEVRRHLGEGLSDVFKKLNCRTIFSFYWRVLSYVHSFPPTRFSRKLVERYKRSKHMEKLYKKVVWKLCLHLGEVKYQ